MIKMASTNQRKNIKKKLLPNQTDFHYQYSSQKQGSGGQTPVHMSGRSYNILLSVAKDNPERKTKIKTKQKISKKQHHHETH